MNKAFEKIVDRLEKERKIMLENNIHQAIALNFAKGIVQEVAEEYKDGWIPCSKRLPEGKINPVTQDYYQYPVMFRDNGIEDIKYYYFGNGHWRYGFHIMDDYVTHWMGIKPYQPKGE